MGGSRLIVVLLVAVALLYLLSAGLGFRNRGEAGPEGEADRRSYEPPAWLDRAGLWMLPFSPTLELEQSSFEVTPDRPLAVSVPPSDSTFRRARFIVTEGPGVVIKYEASDADDSDLAEQTWPEGDDDRQSGSLVILEGGGTLTFTAVGNRPSRVELEE